MIDLVFLKEEADALSHRIGHIAGTANDLGKIVLETAHGDTEVFAVLYFLVQLRTLEKCFGGNTTPVQASASGALLLDAGNFLAELSGADSGGVTGRPPPMTTRS